MRDNMSIRMKLPSAQMIRLSYCALVLTLTAQQATKKDPAPSVLLNVPTQNICAGSLIPAGWIKTDDQRVPTMCGGPSVPGFNVFTITQFSVMKVGSTLSVCNDAYGATPSGWVVIDTSWVPTRCGRPSSNAVQNVKLIRRVS